MKNEKVKIDKSLTRLVDFWCKRGDLNSHEINHTPLKRARLPVPPLLRIGICLNIISCFSGLVKRFFQVHINLTVASFIVWLCGLTGCQLNSII